MTEADRISTFADVDHGLAELVVMGANRTGSSIRALRGPSRALELIAARRWIIARARPRYSFPEIGRALNRDHTTIVHHDQWLRRARPAANHEGNAP